MHRLVHCTRCLVLHIRCLALHITSSWATHTLGYACVIVRVGQKVWRIWIRRITVSVYGNFRSYPYPYDRTWVLADCIYTPYVTIQTVYTPYMDCICMWCRVRFPATAVLFALLVNFFSRFFLLSSSSASLFCWCMCFAFTISFVGDYGSWPFFGLFGLKQA